MEVSKSYACFLLLLAVLVAFMASPSQGYVFYVGGRDGWVVSPSESYSHWAGRNRFQINDTLVFKYKKGENSVLVVSKEDYDSCSDKNPIAKLDGGDSTFTFVRSGPFFFISGVAEDCNKGQKLIVVVLALRHRSVPPAPVSSPPSLPPSSPTATSPVPSPQPSIIPPSPSPSSVVRPPADSPASSPSPSSSLSAPSPSSTPTSSPPPMPPAPASALVPGLSPSSATSPSPSPASPQSQPATAPASALGPGTDSSPSPSPSPSPPEKKSASSVITSPIVLLVLSMALGGLVL